MTIADGQIDEGVGHGTHVAGIISLVAPGAKILPIRVLNSDGVEPPLSLPKASITPINTPRPTMSRW